MFLVSASVHASDNPFGVSAELDETLKTGLHELYNLNFDEAIAIFNSAKEHSADHPMVSFGITSAHWWRLSVYVLENDAEESKPFLESVKECIRLSEARIKKGDKTGEAYLTLGGAEGLLGRWQAANRQWLPAYFKGKSAYKNLRKSLKVNPEMMDAYMGLGIFDYYVATLPTLVRILAFLGQGGDPAKGLKELHMAADNGTYAKTPSLLFLVNIYSSLENQPAKALELLDRLWVEFPKSPFIHMLRIVALYNHGSIEQLQDVVQLFGERVKDETYRAEFKTQAEFAAGITAFREKDWGRALENFDRGIAAGTVKDPFYSWSYLYRGYCLDALGRREAAVKQYEEVLAQLRRWSSHESAQSRIKKPFSPEGEPELKKLIL